MTTPRTDDTWSAPPPPWLDLEDRNYISSRYEILQEVGQGGMGIVYRALHRTLQMEVAIKVLRRGLSPERFLREGRILGRLRSPNVVTGHKQGVYHTLAMGPALTRSPF